MSTEKRREIQKVTPTKWGDEEIRTPGIVRRRQVENVLIANQVHRGGVSPPDGSNDPFLCLSLPVFARSVALLPDFHDLTDQSCRQLW